MKTLKRLWDKFTKPKDEIPEEMKRQLDECVDEVVEVLRKIVEDEEKQG